MFGFSEIDNAWIITFFFILLRVSGALLITPIFGRKNLPLLMRLGFCLYLSIIVITILPESAYAFADDTVGFYGNAIKELALGITMGFVGVAALTIAVAAGQIIDMQIGFGLSNFFDRQLGTQIAVTGNFLNIITILAFFALNGHHRFIEIVYMSFLRIKPGAVVIGYRALDVLFKYFIWFIVMAVQVAIPIISVIVITEFALGIIMKTVPQMNFFVIGISLKIFVGLLILMLFISAYIVYLNGVFDQMFVWLEKIVDGMW